MQTASSCTSRRERRILLQGRPLHSPRCRLTVMLFSNRLLSETFGAMHAISRGLECVKRSVILGSHGRLASGFDSDYEVLYCLS
ncbi:unnamed protein product [Chondrus crispus]|uniref:Uncharacterized protein n=1 Tax=Chondrus crispus TaxID=2769 RepID=R7Q8Z7_CHOCR|nr:unnamed protein product [Chondrus crispus]CDF33871.1 unnamed protein product [Chondrus crispus]|eukprot:XP_005713690.1 unnamed protein product [Chondrus crispus]